MDFRSTTRHVTFDTQEPVLDAVPLSVVPYSGRPTSTNNHAPSSVQSILNCASFDVYYHFSIASFQTVHGF